MIDGILHYCEDCEREFPLDGGACTGCARVYFDDFNPLDSGVLDQYERACMAYRRSPPYKRLTYFREKITQLLVQEPEIPDDHMQEILREAEKERYGCFDYFDKNTVKKILREAGRATGGSYLTDVVSAYLIHNVPVRFLTELAKIKSTRKKDLWKTKITEEECRQAGEQWFRMVYLEKWVRIAVAIMEIPAPKLTGEEQYTMEKYFIFESRVYRRFCAPDFHPKTNIYMNYIFIKIFELIGRPDLIPWVSMDERNQQTIIKYDNVWWRICHYYQAEQTGTGLSWVFIPTYVQNYRSLSIFRVVTPPQHCTFCAKKIVHKWLRTRYGARHYMDCIFCREMLGIPHKKQKNTKGQMTIFDCIRNEIKEAKRYRTG